MNLIKPIFGDHCLVMFKINCHHQPGCGVYYFIGEVPKTGLEDGAISFGMGPKAVISFSKMLYDVITLWQQALQSLLLGQKIDPICLSLLNFHQNVSHHLQHDKLSSVYKKVKAEVLGFERPLYDVLARVRQKKVFGCQTYCALNDLRKSKSILSFQWPWVHICRPNKVF